MLRCPRCATLVEGDDFGAPVLSYERERAQTDRFMRQTDDYAGRGAYHEAGFEQEPPVGGGGEDAPGSDDVEMVQSFAEFLATRRSARGLLRMAAR